MSLSAFKTILKRAKVLKEFGLHIRVGHGWTTDTDGGEIASFTPGGTRPISPLFTLLGGSVNLLFCYKASSVSFFLPIMFLCFQSFSSQWFCMWSKHRRQVDNSLILWISSARVGFPPKMIGVEQANFRELYLPFSSCYGPERMFEKGCFVGRGILPSLLFHWSTILLPEPPVCGSAATVVTPTASARVCCR